MTLHHREPERFGPQEAELMQASANQLALVLENAKLYSELQESLRSVEAYSGALTRELEEGIEIQRHFLPTELPNMPDWQIAACFHPARKVAGDFYDVFALPGEHLGLVIADVCDKGVGAALFMAMCRSLIRIFSGQILLCGIPLLAVERTGTRDGEPLVCVDPLEALKAVAFTNSYIAREHGQFCMFATMFFGVLNHETGLLIAEPSPGLLHGLQGGVSSTRVGRRSELPTIRSPHEAPMWAYQVARLYAERYDSRYGTGLIPEPAPMVEEIADFWSKNYLGETLGQLIGS